MSRASYILATKRIRDGLTFGTALSQEATSLNALADLLSAIRGVSGGVRGISTRSKAAKAGAEAASSKGKGRLNGIRNNPMFKPTPLQELYIDENGAVTDAELSQRMIWEQLEMRTTKVLDLYKEIVRDGDSSGEEDNDAEVEMEEGFDEGDSDEELLDAEDDEMLGEMDEEEGEEDSDDEEEEEEDEGDYTPPELDEPYFAPLRDSEEDEEAEEEEQEMDSEDDTPTHRKGQKGKSAAQPKSAKGKSPVDRGFFSLSDFNAQTNEAEEEMNRYIRSGKSKSANDISLNGLEDDDDEDEEIDYFAPAAGMGDEDDEEDEEEDEEGDEDGVRPEDMRYDDFWKPPKLLYGDSPKQVAKGKERQAKQNGTKKGDKTKGKGKGRQAEPEPEEPASDADIPVNPTPNGNKRRVSFHDAVKVQEFPSQRKKESPIAALVKKYGHKEALRRIQAGEIDEDDLPEDEDEDDELMLSDMLDGDVEDDDEAVDEDEEDAEEGLEEDEEDAESALSDESGDPDSRAMQRISRDLFAEEDDEEEDDASGALTSKQKKKAQQSRYEARMAALSEQIAELEAENVAERDWTMRGEAKSRDRPVNSLLEEDLEFDQVAKVVPVVTEESSLSLEEKIKKRILDVCITASGHLQQLIRSIRTNSMMWCVGESTSRPRTSPPGFWTSKTLSPSAHLLTFTPTSSLLSEHAQTARLVPCRMSTPSCKRSMTRSRLSLTRSVQSWTRCQMPASRRRQPRRRSPRSATCPRLLWRVLFRRPRRAAPFLRQKRCMRLRRTVP